MGAIVLITAGAAALILRDSTIEGCFVYTAPAPPLRSTDVVVLHDETEAPITNDHVSQDPSFNAAGTRIVFSSGRDGEFHPEYGFERLALFTAFTIGDSQERLTHGPYDHQPNWSPVGSEVVFVRRQFAEGEDPQVALPVREELWTIDVETKAEQLLYEAPPSGGDPYRLYSPVWSPDGRQIAFSRADHRHHDVWIVDRDGSDARRLAAGVSTSYPDSPALDWSPDGEQIVFVGTTDEGEGIHLLEADTGRTQRIAERGSSPVWSPDGSQIAYWEGSAKERDTDYRLFVIDRESNRKELVEGAPLLAYVYGRLDWARC